MTGSPTPEGTLPRSRRRKRHARRPPTGTTTTTPNATPFNGRSPRTESNENNGNNNVNRTNNVDRTTVGDWTNTGGSETPPGKRSNSDNRRNEDSSKRRKPGIATRAGVSAAAYGSSAQAAAVMAHHLSQRGEAAGNHHRRWRRKHRCPTTKKNQETLQTGRPQHRHRLGQSGTEGHPTATSPTSSPATTTLPIPPRRIEEGSGNTTIVPICPGPGHQGTRPGGGTGTTMRGRLEEEPPYREATL